MGTNQEKGIYPLSPSSSKYLSTFECPTNGLISFSAIAVDTRYHIASKLTLSLRIVEAFRDDIHGTCLDCGLFRDVSALGILTELNDQGSEHV